MSNHATTNSAFLIGGGSYHNIPTLRGNATKSEFRLAPIPLSKTSLIAMNLLFAAFFVPILYISYPSNPFSISILVLGTWFVTAVTYTGMVTYVHSKSMSQGPAFVFCKKSGNIRLPRHDQEFAISENIWIECITAKHENDPSGDACSELNFNCIRNGIAERWNLLRSTATINPFNGLDREIQRETGIPLRRVSG